VGWHLSAQFDNKTCFKTLSRKLTTQNFFFFFFLEQYFVRTNWVENQTDYDNIHMARMRSEYLVRNLAKIENM
jgi:hypothetical protein